MSQTLTLLRLWTQRTSLTSGMTAQAMLFFILCLTASVLAIGNEQNLLMQIMPALLWVVLLLASLLGLSDIFAENALNHSLDDLILAPHSLSKLMFLKLLAHFMAAGLPISLIAPLILYMMDTQSLYDPRFIFIGLATGALYFSSIGLLASALALNARRNIALYAAIVLPLALPGLIFGAGSFAAIPLGLDNRPAFYLLAALATAFTTLSPFAAAFIIRMKGTT